MLRANAARRRFPAVRRNSCRPMAGSLLLAYIRARSSRSQDAHKGSPGERLPLEVGAQSVSKARGAVPEREVANSSKPRSQRSIRFHCCRAPSQPVRGNEWMCAAGSVRRRRCALRLLGTHQIKSPLPAPFEPPGALSLDPAQS